MIWPFLRYPDEDSASSLPLIMRAVFGLTSQTGGLQNIHWLPQFWCAWRNPNSLTSTGKLPHGQSTYCTAVPLRGYICQMALKHFLKIFWIYELVRTTGPPPQIFKYKMFSGRLALIQIAKRKRCRRSFLLSYSPSFFLLFFYRTCIQVPVSDKHSRHKAKP